MLTSDRHGSIHVELPRFDSPEGFAPGARVYLTPKRVRVFGDPVHRHSGE
jgi:hypothetical protein